MSLRPDHVEAARPGLWRDPLGCVAPLFGQISPAIGKIRLRCRETGVRLDKSGPAMAPGQDHLGNVG
jgi:hypothetical protein